MTKVFDVFRLALKDIRSYWRSLATPIIGVAIVILIFTSMMAAADGLRATFSSAGKDNIDVLEEGSATPWSSVLARNMSDELEKIQNVDVVSEMVTGFTLDENNRFNLIRGVDVDTYENVTNAKILEGRSLNSNDTTALTSRIMVGQYLADEKDLEVGEFYKLTLFHGLENESEDVTLEQYKFQIVGIFATDTMQDSEMWMPAFKAREVLEMENNETNYFVVKPNDPSNIDQVIQDIEASIDGIDAVKESKVWQSMSDMLDQFVVILNLIIITTVLAAVMGILNVMINLIDERRHEIAILKAVGFENTTVLSMFIMEALVVGFLGGLIGSFGAIIIFRVIGFTVSSAGFTFKAVLTIPTIIKALLLSTGIGGLAGLYPVIKTIRIKPVEVLRT
ncbi:MAG: ABC transporter permease [Promethearchaeota archaeon]